MTQLEDLTVKGFVVQINDFVEEGHPIHIPASAQVFTDFVEHGGSDVLIFHTKDYNYIAYPWPEAHERNMEIIYSDIERAALVAEMRLHQTVTELYRRDRKRAAKHQLVLYGEWQASEPYEGPDGHVRIDFTTGRSVASDQIIEALKTNSGKRKA